MSSAANATLRMGEESSKVVSRMERQGIDLPELPPLSLPMLPKDITDIGETELMGLFTEFTAWGDYMSSQAACAQIDERTSQRKLDHAEATALLAGWKGGSGDRVTVVKAAVSIDPEVLQLREELDTRHAYRKLIEVMVSNIERNTSLISRELTRRTTDQTRTRKNSWTT